MELRVVYMVYLSSIIAFLPCEIGQAENMYGVDQPLWHLE